MKNVSIINVWENRTCAKFGKQFGKSFLTKRGEYTDSYWSCTLMSTNNSLSIKQNSMLRQRPHKTAGPGIQIPGQGECCVPERSKFLIKSLGREGKSLEHLALPLTYLAYLEIRNRSNWTIGSILWAALDPS